MSAKKFAWERAWTLVSVLLLLLITVFTVGCFKGEANLTIRADGSAALKTRLLGTDLLKESIVEATNEIGRKILLLRSRRSAKMARRALRLLRNIPT